MKLQKIVLKDAIVCKINLFEVSLNEFLLFPHGRGKSSLVIDPRPNEAMNELYNTLAKALGLKEERGFKPHIGLGLLKMSESQIRSLVSKYQNEWNESEIGQTQSINILAHFEASKTTRANRSDRPMM